MATRIMTIATLLLATALTACGDDQAEDAASDAGTQEVAPLAKEPAPSLDPATGQASTPAGSVEARRWDGTYVGSVSEDLYVAVMLEEEVEASQPREAVVYLCDGVGAVVLTGEVGSEATTLGDQALAVELSLVDGAVSGHVTVDGEEPQPFTTHEASGQAGLYAAPFSFEGVEYLPMWVVLPDGSQQGAACWQCCSAEGCFMCCGESAQTGNKGGEVARHDRQMEAARPSLWDRFWDWVRN